MQGCVGRLIQMKDILSEDSLCSCQTSSQDCFPASHPPKGTLLALDDDIAVSPSALSAMSV